MKGTREGAENEKEIGGKRKEKSAYRIHRQGQLLIRICATEGRKKREENETDEQKERRKFGYTIHRE